MDFRTWRLLFYRNLKEFDLSTSVKRLIPIAITNGRTIALCRPPATH
jgi:hypothetical protein